MEDCWLALYISIIKNYTVTQAFRALHISFDSEEKRIEQKKKSIKRKKQ